jgi:hypothetical protein
MTLAHGSTARVETLPPDAADVASDEPARCANCETALVGAYCHACGQRTSAHGELSMRRFLATGVHEVSDVDSVLLRTLRTLLLRPGQLTVDYLAGRRAGRYSPFKLYVLVSALYLLVAWGPYHDMQGMTTGLRESPAFDWMRGGARADERFVTDWMARTGEYMAYARFLSVTGFALVVALLFRRPRRPYAAHLVFALHYYAFDFALYLLLLPPVLLARWLTGGWPPAWLIYLLLPVHLWYVYGSARRAYDQSRTRTALKSAGMFLGDLFLSSLGTIVALGAARLAMR